MLLEGQKMPCEKAKERTSMRGGGATEALVSTGKLKLDLEGAVRCGIQRSSNQFLMRKKLFSSLDLFKLL